MGTIIVSKNSEARGVAGKPEVEYLLKTPIIEIQLPKAGTEMGEDNLVCTPGAGAMRNS
jgi:hypothetical protein